MLSAFKRVAFPLRKFATNNQVNGGIKKLISEDIMRMAQSKMAQKGETIGEGAAEMVEAGESTVASKILMAGFLGVIFGGSYMLCRPVQEELENKIKDELLIKKPFLRAMYRTLTVYKSFVDPDTDFLLPDAFPLGHPYYRPYTLCIELEDLLVHSEWSKEKGWAVQKRPWADYFLAYMSQFYEIVIFTTQQAGYAHPVIDKLDGNLQVIMYRLYRDATRYDIMSGNYVKDLNILNRDPRKVILMDCDPKHYTGSHCQPENVIEMKPWSGDARDTYLLDLIPFMETLGLSGLDDIRPIVNSYKGKNIPKVFGENMTRIHKEEKQKSASAQGSSIISTILSYIGLGPRTLSEEEFVKMQVEQHKHFMNEINNVKKMQEEELKKQELMRQEMMEKAKQTKVTLLDFMLYGPEEAIKRNTPEEVRKYMEMMGQAAA